MRTVDISENSVKAIVDAVTKQREVDLLEQFKQSARQEMDLAKAKDEALRKDQEIAQLRAHIASLQGFLTTMTSGNGVTPVFNPYNNGGPAVTTHAAPILSPFPPLPVENGVAPVPAGS